MPDTPKDKRGGVKRAAPGAGGKQESPRVERNTKGKKHVVFGQVQAQGGTGAGTGTGARKAQKVGGATDDRPAGDKAQLI